MKVNYRISFDSGGSGKSRSAWQARQSAFTLTSGCSRWTLRFKNCINRSVNLVVNFSVVTLVPLRPGGPWGQTCSQDGCTCSRWGCVQSQTQGQIFKKIPLICINPSHLPATPRKFHVQGELGHSSWPSIEVRSNLHKRNIEVGPETRLSS